VILSIAMVVVAVCMMLFYRYQVKAEQRSLQAVRGPGEKGPKLVMQAQARLIMAIVVSVAILASALYVVLSQRFGDAAEKWAFGSIGTIVGFWLSPQK
jgi:hypothetical protein